MDEAVRALGGARLPVIVAGQGVLFSEATAELQLLAEMLGAPVMTTMNGKSGFPEHHPLALGAAGATGTEAADVFLRRADLIVGVGTSFSITPFTHPLPPGTPLIQITNDERDVNKDHLAQLALLGDAKVVLRQLVEAIRRAPIANTTRRGVTAETAVRERIGVLTILLNNGAMSGYERAMPIATERYRSKFLSGDYTAVAAGLGAHAERITRCADIAPAIARAGAITMTGRPAVLEFMTREELTLSRYFTPTY